MEDLLRFPVEFEVDFDRAFRIAEVLFDLIRSGSWLVSMPEYRLPRNLMAGTREHALYLTYVISIDYMTDAEKLWSRAREAYELYPERFTLEKILIVNERTLEVFLRRLGARFSSSAARTWKKISAILMDKYGGDPRNMTPQPLTIEEIREKLRDFPYLRGDKLANVYIRAMGETGLFKVKNLDELDIPVDKQVARFTIYTGVLRLKSGKFQGCVNDDPLKIIIQNAWREVAKALGVAPWKLDEPIWNIGSKLCAYRKCGQCPVENLCNRTKGVIFKDNMVIWSV
ncbi:MAG: N-glycosylase/DNA lyase [Candidatus Korarchaeum sp.]